MRTAVPSIPYPGEATPAWLNAVLQQSGVLRGSAVTSVETVDTGAFNSHTSRLKLGYAPGADPTAPTMLVLKRNTSETWSQQAGRDEVGFYQLAAQLEEPLSAVPPCYAAAYAESSGDSYILLGDLSATHAPPVSRDDLISLVRAVPKTVHQESVIDTLVQIHARFWGRPLLGSGNFAVGYWTGSKDRVAAYLERRRASWGKLMEKEESSFPKEWSDLYQAIFDGMPSFWQTYLAPRFAMRQNLTLIHGDTYFSNFLCPKDPDAGQTYLLDWQSPSWDLPGYDLVNLLAAFWSRGQRQEADRERNLLRRYHAGLQAHGVQGYSWDDLLADYRIGLVFWVLMPVQDGADGSGKGYWWPKMHCLVDAFADWKCMELMDRS